MEYKDPGRYVPIIYLLYSWGSRFGVPSRVPLLEFMGYGLPRLHCFVETVKGQAFHLGQSPSTATPNEQK